MEKIIQELEQIGAASAGASLALYQKELAVGLADLEQSRASYSWLGLI